MGKWELTLLFYQQRALQLIHRHGSVASIHINKTRYKITVLLLAFVVVDGHDSTLALFWSCESGFRGNY